MLQPCGELEEPGDQLWTGHQLPEPGDVLADEEGIDRGTVQQRRKEGVLAESLKEAIAHQGFVCRIEGLGIGGFLAMKDIIG